MSPIEAVLDENELETNENVWLFSKKQTHALDTLALPEVDELLYGGA